LVVKTRRPDDRRALHLSLSPAGRQLAAESHAWPGFLAKAVGDLEANERGVLLRTLISLIRQLHQAGQIPVARLCVTCRFFQAHADAEPGKPHFCALLQAGLAEADLRVDCPEQEPADSAAAEAQWRRWRDGRS
jgi:hypothetical protein